MLASIFHKYTISDISKVDYADLRIIDLSKADTSEGRAELAIQVRDSMTTQGFFYVINHGYTQAQVFYDDIYDNLSWDMRYSLPF